MELAVKVIKVETLRFRELTADMVQAEVAQELLVEIQPLRDQSQ
jgi:hypothetical protein